MDDVAGLHAVLFTACLDDCVAHISLAKLSNGGGLAFFTGGSVAAASGGS
jgi:hypothetical protein